jgi:hypothetical protein
MENLDHILIFKTSIRNPADRESVRAGLDGSVSVQQWSVDLEDVDCVLRVVSNGIAAQQVVALVKGCGYDCEELD